MNSSNQPKSIVWLHLSDLHLCEPKTGWDAHRVLEPLIVDLQKMETDHGLQPQLMFFTGDAAFGNYGSGAGSSLSEQYQQVEQFFSGVRKAFKQEIPKENLFLVPGNHDVDRNDVLETQNYWIEEKANAEKITQLIQGGKKDWQQYMERLSIYRKFLQDNDYHHLLTDKERLVYAHVIDIQGVKIGIGGFNSAWNCGRNGEKGKLWLGANWQNGHIVSKLKKQQADLKIALIHHPPGWFVEQEDSMMRVQMERDFDFFLHGHEHQGWVNAINNHHVRIAAAACYERADQENGYNFVRLNLETGDMEIWLRKFDGHGGGWIPRVISGKTNNDGLWLIHNVLVPKPELGNEDQLIKSIRGQPNAPILESLESFNNLGSKVRALGTDNLFADKVREKIKHILTTDKPAVLALREALLKDQDQELTPEQVLIPSQKSHLPDKSIRKWYEITQTCLEQARDHVSEIKKYSSDIFGWLILLCVDGTRLAEHECFHIDLNTMTEIIVPVKTQAGTEVFVASLQNRPAKFQLLASDKSLGEGYIDPADLEMGLLKPDCLYEIKKLVFVQVFRKEPVLNTDWQGLLKHKMEFDVDFDNKMYYLTLPRARHTELLDTVKRLKEELPHLRILIIGKSEAGDSVLIMDESRLEALVLKFLSVLDKF